jgi:hypothetical protein
MGMQYTCDICGRVIDDKVSGDCTEVVTLMEVKQPASGPTAIVVPGKHDVKLSISAIVAGERREGVEGIAVGGGGNPVQLNICRACVVTALLGPEKFDGTLATKARGGRESGQS